MKLFWDTNLIFMLIPILYSYETRTFSVKLKEIPYNQENINKYKAPDNMLKHARYIDGITKGIMYVYRNQLVGYIAWEGQWIIALEVTSKFKRRGYGKMLLNVAVNAGCNRLTVAVNNTNAIKFYQSQGWIIYQQLGHMVYMKLQ